MTVIYSHWTPERTEKLKQLWAEGYSASQIAYQLGNCSRNSVLGKLFRLGIGIHRKTTFRKKSERGPLKTPHITRPVRVPRATLELMAQLPIPSPEETDIARKTLNDLEPCDCRFPIGDPLTRNFGFCALPQVPGLPYCSAHSRRAFVTAPIRTPQAPAETKTPAEVV